MLQITAGNVFNFAFSVSPQYEDQLISPKQFVHLSGKATLKDWKRAIRMGGVMLRSAQPYRIFFMCFKGTQNGVFHEHFYENGTGACEISNLLIGPFTQNTSLRLKTRYAALRNGFFKNAVQNASSAMLVPICYCKQKLAMLAPPLGLLIGPLFWN